ncbi:MAG: four helix bundle protein [Microgenomates group bacterium]|nr:four helix bundle protein [Microgenomates group bacterium]
MNQLPKNHKAYDLEERTARFAEEIIEFIKTIKKDCINQNIIVQLVKSATSVDTNYCEANTSSSKKEKIKFFWGETHQLHLIFQKITNTLNKNLKTKN